MEGASSTMLVSTLQNDFSAGIYPASSYSLLCVSAVIVALHVLGCDATFGLNMLFQNYLFYYAFGCD